ncbi:expressed unknown protein [Seminavis robusta]|uniref:Glycosyl transferase family 25 domain-containing protein n=1 Tax=Seminavis robusta TaxID=568900 RepID=A0A9N8E6V5_9STRA|nr:expressed unknown protein [Seminavis robusta]|eukprot:Sro559_g166430.1 n/a (456) ;mRNA; r:25580-26947
MSSNGTENNNGHVGGAYVPPHRRAQQAGKMPHQTSKPHSHSPHQQQPHPHRPGGRQQGGGNRQGRSPASSPGRKKNNNHHNHHGNSNNRNNNKNYKSKSRSPTNNNNNNHNRHHSPTRKEDLALQKQQMHTLQDALNRICCINLDRRPDRWQSFEVHLHQSLGKKMGHSLWHKVERVSAVDGIPDDMPVSELVESTWDASENAKWDRHIEPPMTKEMSVGEVGCALSHIKLWKELAVTEPKQREDGDDTKQELRQATMLILEDDSLFYSPKLAMNKAALGGRVQPQQQHDNHHPHHLSIASHDFLTAFQLAWSQLPEDWDIWYLGFSDRGDRIPVDDFHLPKPHHHHHDHEHHLHHYPSMSIQMFRPTYGFHTHGYVLSAKAAQTLLDNLPVKGPLDVWLADNQWFGLKVYCSVVKGEGWKGTGAWLITQNRKLQQQNQKDSDIGMSGRKKNNNA